METESTVETSVVDAIAAICRLDQGQVHRDLSLDDLGLGSLGLVAVVTRLEAVYQIEFVPDEIITLLRTKDVGEFIAAVRELMGPRVAAGHDRESK
jgi:acyl carrier protein